jgi:hypothetical protein
VLREEGRVCWGKVALMAFGACMFCIADVEIPDLDAM